MPMPYAPMPMPNALCPTVALHARRTHAQVVRQQGSKTAGQHVQLISRDTIAILLTITVTIIVTTVSRPSGQTAQHPTGSDPATRIRGEAHRLTGRGAHCPCTPAPCSVHRVRPSNENTRKGSPAHGKEGPLPLHPYPLQCTRESATGREREGWGGKPRWHQ
ncbi:hypothetical protein B484DRAFT_113446 [Ochromonadaceae sp. CCMP2298]|nr:hypothetical protein B484DRAFT_113446 [Ochromonadaceae sp. CCMP2298]